MNIRVVKQSINFYQSFPLYGPGKEEVLLDMSGFIPSKEEAMKILKAAEQVLSMDDSLIELENDAYRNYLQNECQPSVSRQPMKPKSGYVYLAHAKHSDRYKIGYSKKPIQREEQLKGQSPEPITFIHTIKTDDIEKLESDLHLLFQEKRVHGEWFDLSESDVKYVLSLK